jgi:hypothetical protein
MNKQIESLRVSSSKEIKALEVSIAEKDKRIVDLEMTVGALVAFNRRALSKQTDEEMKDAGNLGQLSGLECSEEERNKPGGSAAVQN